LARFKYDFDYLVVAYFLGHPVLWKSTVLAGALDPSPSLHNESGQIRLLELCKADDPLQSQQIGIG